jgi:hypothetical protein
MISINLLQQTGPLQVQESYTSIRGPAAELWSSRGRSQAMSGFVWSDAWVLLALVYAAKPAPREGIRAAGDYINHAVMSDEELDGGLNKLLAAGLVSSGPKGWVLAGRAAGLNAEIDRASEAANDRSPLVGFKVVEQLLDVASPWS